MSERTELLPGSFCWPELATPDAAKAKAFYAGLFGWEPVDVPTAGGAYALLKLRGKDVAALRTLSGPELEQKVPSHFMTYVSTASVDASAAKAAELGGKVCHGPFDVEGVGRMAVVSDPEGVVFALWEARGHIGAQLVGEENTLCWTELGSRDPDAATAFYGGLFGWTFEASGASGPGEYVEIRREGQEIGGILPMRGDGWGGVPARWGPYFFVTDCDAVAANAAKLGGAAVVPPTDIPHVGRFALLRDDQGAHFSVIAMAPMPAAG